MTVWVALAATFVATKVLGDVAQRLKQPAVLGELIAGVVLGGSVLGVLDPGEPFIHAASELGVIILLFAIGLETELASLARAGGAATMVAVTGVVLPMVLGYYAAVSLGLQSAAALVCGAALCATSVGITARVLSDLGWLEAIEGRVILGAAVLDDIIGLVILSVVASLVSGGPLGPLDVLRIAGVALAFVIGALLVGTVVARPAFKAAARIRAPGALGTLGVAFALLLSWLAQKSGSAMIVGAFAAGVILNKLPQRAEIEKATTTLGHFFVPVFFASVGAAVDFRLTDPRALLVGAVLLGCGIVGKLAAGYGAWWFRGDKLLVGIGMIPRGEVGLIFAQMGLTAGAVNASEYGALMLMVLGTTMITPPALAWRARRLAPRRRPSADRPGDGGVDDLVAGER